MIVQTIFVISYEACLVIFLKRAAEIHTAFCWISWNLTLLYCSFEKHFYHFSWTFKTYIYI